MHPHSLTPTLDVVASRSSSASRSHDTQAADAAAIEAGMKSYAADIRANDAAKIASWWVEDGIYIDGNAPTVRGRAGMESHLKDVFAALTITSLSVERDDLAVSGDLAYYLGRYHQVLQPRQGPAVDKRGRFVFIWKRQSDGTWKIARSVGTELDASAAAPPVAEKDASKASG